ncbi:flagellar biogenesis protein FliO [Arthrobacter woluwensis]|uniref:hypothetical protein n=1 Tax=Arthrobacter woluwensis TaxID=156980 RepID=UPI0027862D64|nr:hypothetical protein [Arthrobacter woluwensis]MDQ0709136.1 flagellar biogenesis protein FliO [Arthrobacter woluwensis]
MSAKVSVLPIVKDHFATLRDARNGKISFGDLFTQLGVPVLAGGTSYAAGLNLDQAYGNVVAALAIVFGFAFAVAVFVFQLRMQMADLQVSAEQSHVAEITPLIDTRAPQLVNELFSNCLYAVVVSGATTVLATAAGPFHLGRVGDSALLTLVIHLALVLMMCLKRLNSAFTKVAKRRSH